MAIARSDHHARVAGELEPALLLALAETPADAIAVEIGCLQGGSAVLIAWHIANEGANREFITVDTTDLVNQTMHPYREPLGVNWTHHQADQTEWCKALAAMPRKIGYLYHDGNHDFGRVMQDVSMAAPCLVPGAILAIDDVCQWSQIPDLEHLGLTLVELDVECGQQHNGHVAFWRKN